MIPPKTSRLAGHSKYEIRPLELSDRDAAVAFLSDHLPGTNTQFQNIYNYAASGFGLIDKDEKSRRPLGNCLIDQKGEIVGVLACLAHKQSQCPKLWVCNMTSWTVAPHARPYSMKMLSEFISYDDRAVTNFSANDVVQRILPKFGFDRIDAAEITVMPSWRGFSQLKSKMIQGEEGLAFLGAEQQRTYREHLQFGCRMGAFVSGENTVVFLLAPPRPNSKGPIQILDCRSVRGDMTARLWQQAIFRLAFQTRNLTFRTDLRMVPNGIPAAAVKKRDMFLKSPPGVTIDLSRYYSEPVHISGDFG